MSSIRFVCGTSTTETLPPISHVAKQLEHDRYTLLLIEKSVWARFSVLSSILVSLEEKKRTLINVRLLMFDSAKEILMIGIYIEQRLWALVQVNNMNFLFYMVSFGVHNSLNGLKEME